MPLEESDVIDLALKSKSGQLRLVITDSGETSDPALRFSLFCKKIKCYAEYVESPQFANQYPDILPGDVSIELVCDQPPTPEMSEIKGVALPGDSKVVLPITHKIFQKPR